MPRAATGNTKKNKGFLGLRWLKRVKPRVLYHSLATQGAMETTELRIVISSRDWRRGSPMDMQEPLEQALAEAGLGEITRGGAAPGRFFLIAEVTDTDRARRVLLEVLVKAGAPASTRIEALGGRKPVDLR